MRLVPTILIAHAVLIAQTATDHGAGERARAAALLRSPLVADRAWGAHMVATLGLSEQVPALLEELRTVSLSSAATASYALPTADSSYVQALLDALIQMDARADSEVLLRFWPAYRNEVLILLLRRPSESEEALRGLLNQELPDNHWLAVNNGLLAAKSAALPALLIKKIRIVHRVMVSDGGPVTMFSCGGAIGNAISTRQFALGFPPTGVYKLERQPLRGDTVAALGPHIVYYRREVVPTSEHIRWEERISIGDRQQYRIDYLAALAQMSREAASQAIQPSTQVQWKGEVSFIKAVDAAVSLQSSAFRTLLWQLPDTDAMAPLNLQILFTVHDTRSDQSVPLPANAPRLAKI